MYNKYIYYLKLLLKFFLIIMFLSVCIIIYYIIVLPDYSKLYDYKPPTITRIYSKDCKLIEEYALEHRVFVPIASIPKSLIEAFIAAEDKNFYYHSGIDFLGLIRALTFNMTRVFNERKMEGASTITQQVVKNILLSNERSISRKIKEAIISCIISHKFSKDQILELYLNQIFFGKRSFGVAAAAKNYFNKSVDELNLVESAFIAALPKGPTTYDPEKNYEKSKNRRDYVLFRMLEDGYINKNTFNNAVSEPINLFLKDAHNTVKANYYAEHVREEVIKIVGKDTFYTGGLTIITTLNSCLQEAAVSALQKCIQQFDRKQKFRGIESNINVDNWLVNLNNIMKPKGILDYEIAVVLSNTEDTIKIGIQNGNITKLFINPNLVDQNNKPVSLNIGDVITVKKSNYNRYTLVQIPEVNGAIFVMNVNSGDVLASQGGYSFDKNKFDGVTQALRQPGSVIKPFVYLTALEHGIEPNYIFEDTPIEIFQGKRQSLWRPKNYNNTFLGPVTMRTGLEKSRNIVTVKVAQSVGLDRVANTIKRFGINNHPPLYYSMVLGSLETTLEKITTAYGIIANNGKKISPKYIELIKDSDGKVIYSKDNSVQHLFHVNDKDIKFSIPSRLNKLDNENITDEASNYQLISMLLGVVDRGTASAIKKFNHPVACKTGTSNDSRDTWLICFTPKIVVGTRLGYDIPKSMGKRAVGANVPMPAMINFLNFLLKNAKPEFFKVPNSVKFVPVDVNTGEVVLDKKNCNSILEVFKNDLHNLNLNDNLDIKINNLEEFYFKK